MKCPRCQQENPPQLKFCGECGARLASTCPACKASNAPAQKFCGECGAALTPAAPYTPRHLAERILTSKASLEGERVEWEEHWQTASAMYREMGMTYWLEKAERETKDLAR